MDLKQQLDAHLKEAMRARDSVRLRTIRALRAALLDKEISERQGGEAELTEQQALAVLQKQAKQRRDSIAQFEQAGRDDLVAKEQEELDVIEAYLPKQMDDDAIRPILEEIIQQTGAESMRDMGKVMGQAMQKLRGKADGKRINVLVKELLSA